MDKFPGFDVEAVGVIEGFCVVGIGCGWFVCLFVLFYSVGDLLKLLVFVLVGIGLLIGTGIELLC